MNYSFILFIIFFNFYLNQQYQLNSYFFFFIDQSYDITLYNQSKNKDDIFIQEKVNQFLLNPKLKIK